MLKEFKEFAIGEMSSIWRSESSSARYRQNHHLRCE